MREQELELEYQDKKEDGAHKEEVGRLHSPSYTLPDPSWSFAGQDGRSAGLPDGGAEVE